MPTNLHDRIFFPIPACYNGNTQLVNSTYSYIDGDYYYGGRVEVCYNGIYRPVCAENWNDSDAAVVCYSVGYSSPYYRKYLDLILISKNIHYFLRSS